MDKGTLMDVKASIRSLIMSTRNSMTIQDLQKDFKEFVGYPLPHASLGYKNAEQLLRALPDVVRLSGYGPQAVVNYVPNEKTQHIAELIRNQKVTTNKRQKRGITPRGRISYPLYPVTINTSEEVAAFERLDINDRNPLPKSNENWNNFFTKESIIEASKFLTSAQHHGENENQQRKPDTVLYENETNALNSSNETSNQKDVVIHKRFNITYSSTEDSDDNNTTIEPYKNLSSTLPMASTTESHRSVVRLGPRYFPIKEIQNASEDAVPEDAMTEIIENIGLDKAKSMKKYNIQQRLEIPQCKLYEDLKKGSVISLYISEIYSPLMFFFHIDKENHELLKLEMQMKDTYSKLAFNDLIMIDSHLQPGRYCAAKNDDIWYRAKILSVPNFLNDFSKIKLLFIDYGCIDYIPVKYLKLLAPIFFSIPTQAACGRLSQLKSNDVIRSSVANNFFASLVNDRCLYAYVSNVDKNTLLLDLILLDTSIEPKCNINEILVKKGFAEKKPYNRK